MSTWKNSETNPTGKPEIYKVAARFYMTTPERNKSSGLPVRNGALWAEQEEQQLLKEKALGFSLKEMAKAHQRVEKAIEIRLEKLQENYEIKHDDQMDQYITSIKYWSVNHPTRNKTLLLL